MQARNSIIIIPARMNATRLPGKPLIEIDGITMIERVVLQAKKTDLPVYVATPDSSIFDLMNNKGINVVMTRDTHSSGTDRIYEALETIDPDKKIDYIINLQGDLPLIYPEYIRILHGNLIQNKFDIITLVAKFKDIDEALNPNHVKAVFSDSKQALYFSRSRIPYNGEEYFHHIGIYGYTRSALTKFVTLPEGKLERIEKLEQLRALENNMTIGVEIVGNIPISIDTEEDLEKIDIFMNDISSAK